MLTTESVMRSLISSARAEKPNEICGFIAGRPPRDPDEPLIGNQIFPIKNVSAKPSLFAEMDADEVKQAYQIFDKEGLEPLAVYHSHPDGLPLMSVRDVASAVDPSLVYLIVGFSDAGAPACAGYTVVNGLATKAKVQVIPDRTDSLAPPVEAPWALTPGNLVEIKYAANGRRSRTIEATVLKCNFEAATLKARSGAMPASLPLSRVYSVAVINEGPVARKLRIELQRALTTAVLRMETGEPQGEVAEAMSKAYDTIFKVTTRKGATK